MCLNYSRLLWQKGNDAYQLLHDSDREKFQAMFTSHQDAINALHPFESLKRTSKSFDRLHVEQHIDGGHALIFMHTFFEALEKLGDEPDVFDSILDEYGGNVCNHWFHGLHGYCPGSCVI